MFCPLIILVLLLMPDRVWPLICTRYPKNTLMPKSPVDENFVISVSGNPQTYILGQEYNISLNAFNGLRYVSFILALENDNGDISYSEDLGRFEITDTVETRYSPNCINMVESTNTNPKTHIDVTWVAPTEPGSGCILIRATLLQHRDVWYMDDGGLTKRICEEVVDVVESQSTAVMARPCCACDEARYEITFEGLWSRNLHPKDFPTKGWLTRFSDILGAAHTADFRFWEYGVLASEGMREFAEHGSSRSLEREFNENFKNGQIRTIIKARGPAFPNLNGLSIASIRADPQHHLVSLASKIDPSPDWIVGVSGLELCMSNCTWLEQKVINLYPWDVGTDAGPSYTSADQPQIPPDVIRRMRSDFPNDPRSPFFDETGAPMKPLATLTVKRQRLYERVCEDEESNLNIPNDIPRECLTHPWSAWSTCTAKCGEGRQYRMRVYKQPEVAKIYNCDTMMVNREDRTCVGNSCRAGDESNDRNYNFRRNGGYSGEQVEFMPGNTIEAECELTDWGSWSACNQTCGEGAMIRRRQYVNPMAKEKCQNAARYIKLIEYKKCFGRTCLGAIPNRQRNYGQEMEVDDRVEESEVEEIGLENEGLLRQPTFNRNGINRQWNGMEVEDNYERDNGRTNERDNERINERGNERNNERNNERYQFLANRNDQAVPDTETNYYANPLENSNDNVQSNFEVGNLRSGDESNKYEAQYQYQNRPQAAHYPQTNSFAQIQQHTNLYETPLNSNNNNNKRVTWRKRENRYQQLDFSTAPRQTIPNFCVVPLKNYPCHNDTVLRNAWFYNYCQDECMLYAVDSCDMNLNSFISLERCERRCRGHENSEFLKWYLAGSCYNGRMLPAR